MPRVKTTHPAQSRQPNQRSQRISDHLTRYLPNYTQPEWLDAQMWRQIVARQPIAQICKNRLTEYVLSLDYKIEPRDSTQRDELKDEIRYYTRFIENNSVMDYATLTEWLMDDFQTIPFGAAVEVGREGDSPDGRVLWIEPLDGGTLFPTLSYDYPVGQRIPNSEVTQTVYFPSHAINRLYMSPRTEIMRKGWGMPPPEKIYLALELLNRGDKYYANLLLDTPEVGILDLGDVSEESAKEWLEGWRTMLGGIDPFKIPVLYEHEKPANFISFTRSPTELMFDKATMKYAAICCAGYGMSLSDIGISSSGNGGETLAGSIRQERATRKAGLTRSKRKLKLFWDRILPEELEFKFIDLDDELAVALGRARLADATAFAALIDRRIFTPEEARQQIIADGLVSISVPESLPEGAFDELEYNNKPASPVSERPGLLGRPIVPSQGGWGEGRSMALRAALQDAEFRKVFEDVELHWEELSEEGRIKLTDEMSKLISEIQEKI